MIEFYLKILEQKGNTDEMPGHLKVQVFPNSFYKELRAQAGKCQVKPSIFESDLVMFPIQKSNHWGLAVSHQTSLDHLYVLVKFFQTPIFQVIDFRKQKITYYDPLLLNDYECLKNLT